MTKKNSEPVSYGYQKISLDRAHRLTGAWLDKTLPQSQWQIVAPILKDKKVPEVAIPVVEIVKRLELKQPSILDVGCSSGYYCDFFKWAGLEFKYAGCDVSPHFISLAKKRHRWVDFKVAPITKLPYKNNSFDVVLASGVMHCELDYHQAMRELVRISSSHVLLHRLPIFATSGKEKTSYFKKFGYGIEMMEVVFNWETLIKMFAGLKLDMRKFLAGDRLDIEPSAHWSTISLKKTN